MLSDQFVCSSVNFFAKTIEALSGFKFALVWETWIKKVLLTESQAN